MSIEKDSHDCETITAEFGEVVYRFDVDELCREFFGDVRVPDEVLQECADTLAANIEMPGYDGSDVVDIDRHNFNDSFDDMVADMTQDYIGTLVKREKALYAIALECFEELTGFSMADSDMAKKRLDDAIKQFMISQGKDAKHGT